MESMETNAPLSQDDDEDFGYLQEGGTVVHGIYIPPAANPSGVTVTPNGPRLLITQVTNNFFKSYAKNVILGPFHQRFNAVVGPNGSGKSNVIDALLFVFGYRATKIRCKKLSILLHNSEQCRNVQSCSVAIHFVLIVDKEEGDYEIVPGSEFVVSRTAKKDNSSYYEINGNRVQFKEVAILLKKHGIDLDHNRFLILQGEVEQISMMKCKGEKPGETGMLEYLEDIIGTSHYKKPLELFNEKIEELTERRFVQLGRMRIVQKDVEELKEPMEQAVTFLKTENTLAKKNNMLYQKLRLDLEVKANEEQRLRDEVLEVQKGFIEKLNSLTIKKKERQKKWQEESQIRKALTKRHEELKAVFDKAYSKDLQLQESMAVKNKARKETKKQIVVEKENLAKLEKIPDENVKAIKEIEQRESSLLAEKERQEAEKSVILKKTQRETEGLQKQKEEMQKELAVLKESVDQTKSAYTLAETELKVCQGIEENEKTKLADLKQSLETCSRTISERSQQITELKRKLPASRQTFDEANAELLRINQRETMLSKTIQTKRACLEESKSSMQASRSQSRVLDALMQAKREGKCPGLFGRLGDLGAIDLKYDVAVSTACGPLDNIVVDTVDCAQWCIEFLKRHDIGRAVFIALEKQEHLRERANSSIRTPENVHRLFDLIRVQDDRVRTAFYFALRDTLVANDLEQASRIAYGATRYRVVTLKGDLIETSGTMSGGGKRVLKGRMGQSVAVSNVDPRELNQLEDEVQKMEIEFKELRQRQISLEAQVAELQPLLREMQINIEKYTPELKSLQNQQPMLQRQIKAQEALVKQTKSDAAQVKRLTAIVEKRKQEYQAACATAAVLQSKVEEITKEIKEKTTKNVSKVEKSIRECAKTIEKCKSEITKLTVAVKTAERDYRKTKDNIARLEQLVVELEEAFRAMKLEREVIEGDAAKLMESMREISKELEQRENDFAEADSEFERISEEETKLKSEKIDIDEKLKSHETELRNLKAVANSYIAKRNHLKLEAIPDEAEEELKQFSKEELENVSVKTLEQEIQNLEGELKKLKPNLNVIQDYHKKRTVYLQRMKELEETSTKRTEMQNLQSELNTRRRNEFFQGFQIIKMKYKEMYQMITLGGDAELDIVNSFDPFADGIKLHVRPPKKTWKTVSNLSGGEKTLSSLSLVFALHHYKPSPLYVMDEIDAALDYKNVSIIANYIKERTKNAQFIIISHRSNMFELADRLVGIYKTNNTTKSITYNTQSCDNLKPTENGENEHRGIEVCV